MGRHILTVLGVAAALSSDLAAQHATAGGVAVRVLSHQAFVRSALGDLVPPERRVSQLGIELILPTLWRALRVEGRVLRSALGQADLRSLDAGLVFGSRAVGVAAAFGQRGSYDPETGLAHTREAEFGRVGLRLRVGDPDAFFVLHLRGDSYLPLTRVDSPSDSISGWDAEGGVTWRSGQLPFTASLGYRLERFRVFSVEQEVSALTFALGVAFGER